ncbi:MAG: hypothetical protein EAZ53_15890 [Bacteroidetes bacterium]|nr:MAG: hypothetical protein EAZ53_15890 [Bacteroidota bacterium]
MGIEIPSSFFRVNFHSIHSKYCSAEIIHKYDLGSGASVLKAIIALEKREVLDRMLSKVEFLDPVFKIWFKQVFRIYV